MFKRTLGTAVLFLVVLASYLCVPPAPVSAEEPETATTSSTAPFSRELVLARVIRVRSSETRHVPGTDVDSTYQSLEVKALDGRIEGTTVTVENDFLALKAGDKFYLMHTAGEDGGPDTYAVMEPYRIPGLLILALLFFVAVIVFGGVQGMRGLVSLAGGLALIMLVLLPGVLKGYPPLLITTGVAALIIIVGSYITHGVSKATSSAVLGMIFTVLLTGWLAFVFMPLTHLSGFYTEETTTLNFNTQGTIDFQGLLLGGIIIGLLGVLYDIAIGQAISVEELHQVAPHVPRRTIFARATRIGREHIGALVNTLAIAYVGAALPILLLFYTSLNSTVTSTLNSEIVATEIVRILIGSIGLVVAVPITTAIAVAWIVRPHAAPTQPGLLAEETRALDGVEHHHG